MAALLTMEAMREMAVGQYFHRCRDETLASRFRSRRWTSKSASTSYDVRKSLLDVVDLHVARKEGGGGGGEAEESKV